MGTISSLRSEMITFMNWLFNNLQSSKLDLFEIESLWPSPSSGRRWSTLWIDCLTTCVWRDLTQICNKNKRKYGFIFYMKRHLVTFLKCGIKYTNVNHAALWSHHQSIAGVYKQIFSGQSKGLFRQISRMWKAAILDHLSR